MSASWPLPSSSTSTLGFGGGLAWADDQTLFYVRQDDAHRPYQVWRHTLGAPPSEDTLVYEDTDELFNVACWRSRDGSLIFIESESKETTEVHLVPSGAPETPPAGDGDKPSGGDDDKPDEPPLAMA